ncbi:leucine-rich repeat domain-containing protein [Candidatus Cytomitobacter primus]|uniref:Leucine-rich repeat domain-containing protein n=1 Tax=Candidatus Cytomitobacter primus TaxID=2066024 RepID=A0A5C0UHH3_9PROT|nr:hypothetical protein [Candidatus Cytomitobacter primus]QEK38782.1 hypothetical protein FZC34_02615 [Candidatus Cytomitobacter primus]
MKCHRNILIVVFSSFLMYDSPHAMGEELNKDTNNMCAFIVQALEGDAVQNRSDLVNILKETSMVMLELEEIKGKLSGLSSKLRGYGFDDHKSGTESEKKLIAKEVEESVDNQEKTTICDENAPNCESQESQGLSDSSGSSSSGNTSPSHDEISDSKQPETELVVASETKKADSQETTNCNENTTTLLDSKKDVASRAVLDASTECDDIEELDAKYKYTKPEEPYAAYYTTIQEDIEILKHEIMTTYVEADSIKQKLQLNQRVVSIPDLSNASLTSSVHDVRFNEIDISKMHYDPNHFRLHTLELYDCTGVSLPRIDLYDIFQISIINHLGSEMNASDFFMLPIDFNPSVVNIINSNLSGVFMGLSNTVYKLLTLNISHNALKKFEKFSAPKLQVLNGNDNSFTNLPLYLENLQYLFLQNNLINNIDCDNSLKSLRVLDLSGNNLSTLNSNILKIGSIAPNLEELHISHNKMEGFIDLGDIPKLRILKASDNIRLSIRFNRNIEYIDVTNTYIMEVTNCPAVAFITFEYTPSMVSSTVISRTESLLKSDEFKKKLIVN